MEESREIIDVEPTEVESVEPERERFVQFIFDSKMSEFKVDWTMEQVNGMLGTCMADDGYLWVPYDTDKGTGAFINMKNCTNIKIIEREKPQPAPEPEPESDIVVPDPEFNKDEVFGYLDSLKEAGLPMFDTLVSKAPSKFLEYMVKERFGQWPEESLEALIEWRDNQ